MKAFINNGFSNLSVSSRGEYSKRTDDVSKLRREMLNDDLGSFRTDKKNMMRDKMAVSGDIRRAFCHVI